MELKSSTKISKEYHFSCSTMHSIPLALSQKWFQFQLNKSDHWQISDRWHVSINLIDNNCNLTTLHTCLIFCYVMHLNFPVLIPRILQRTKVYKNRTKFTVLSNYWVTMKLRIHFMLLLVIALHHVEANDNDQPRKYRL